MAGEVTLQVRATGIQQTKQALDGLRRDAAQAQSANARTATSPTAAGSPVAAEKKVADERKKIVDTLEKYKRDQAARTTREVDHQLRAQGESEKRAGRSRLQAVQEFATRALAVWQTYSARASALSGAFGGRSREGLLTENFNLQQQMVRVGRDIGVSRPQLQRQLAAGARASGLDPAQLLEAIGAGGDVGGDTAAQAILGNITGVGRAAQAVGVSATTIANPLAQALRMGMPAERIQGFLDQFVGQATASGVDPEDIAGVMGSALSSYGAQTGAQGEEAVMGAMRMQAVMAGAFGGSRGARQGYEATMGMLSDEGFQRRLRGVTGSTGTLGNRVGEQLANPLETLQSIAGSGGVTTRSDFARLAGSTEAGDRLKTVIESLRRGGGAVEDALSASGAAGAAYTTGTMSELQGIAGFGNQANQMANFMESGQGFARYADQMADGLDTMNSKFPLAIEGLENFTDAAEKFIGLMGGVGLMGGATGAAGALGGGTGAATGLAGATIGGVSALTVGAVAGVGVAGVGAVYLTHEEQMRQAAERRANMGEEEGQFQDFTQGEMSAGDLLRTRLERRAAQGAATSEILTGQGVSGDAAALNLPALSGTPPQQSGRTTPMMVQFDPSTTSALANQLGAAIAAERGRGESER